MALPLSVSMLRGKRDAIASYEIKLKQAQADLAHVRVALRLFEVSGEPSDFPPHVDRNRVFRRGETTAPCIAALKPKVRWILGSSPSG